jgi:hypothetical protein
MDFEEHIARLIEPDAWNIADYLQFIELPITARKTTESSLIVARRVIAGLVEDGWIPPSILIVEDCGAADRAPRHRHPGGRMTATIDEKEPPLW